MESEAAPYIGMLMAEFCQVGLMIISKQAMNTGMTTFVFVSYSNALASLILLPFSLFLHRSNLPPLSFSLLGWFFLLALSGMEMLNTRNITCLAKLVGTIVSIAGAFVVTLYEGPPLLKRLATLHTHQLSLRGDQMNWILGGFFLAIDCVMASSWVIIQAIILKKYPAELIVVFFYCFFVAIQSGIVTLIVERDLSAWSLKPTLRLLAILYSAIFGSALQVGLCSWCLRRKGPVFVCMFKPLGIAIAAIAGVVFFGDTLFLGSLLGVIIIVLGFYSVMWGKAKEEKKIHAGHFSSMGSPTQTMPLLENYADEMVNAAA
uniref:WAT1-related protein n=1 Tax=Chenopodium quinoa TaxID=63459 RepID=A0A803LJ31_CHEQI